MRPCSGVATFAEEVLVSQEEGRQSAGRGRVEGGAGLREGKSITFCVLVSWFGATWRSGLVRVQGRTTKKKVKRESDSSLGILDGLRYHIPTDHRPPHAEDGAAEWAQETEGQKKYYTLVFTGYVSNVYVVSRGLQALT